MSRKKKYVYFFGAGKTEGHAGMKDLLGGKGANLAEMANLGIPVPPGFTITTEACIYYDRHEKHPPGMWSQVEAALAKLERLMQKRFGDPQDPLLLSVRSGARVSMPGMMDTVLNLGLNRTTVEGLAAITSNPRFAYDSYRRLINMFGGVVMDIGHHHFEDILSAKKQQRGADLDTELTAEDLKEVCNAYESMVRNFDSASFPHNPLEQLKMAVNAVFGSWDSPRAITYRRLNKIPGHWGTAVNIQTMVFGNLGETSGTGVAFTRDPATGARTFYGEYLMNSQGEDVVAGIRTPRPIRYLKRRMPKIYNQLEEIYERLERHYKDMQDIEFTIQDGELYMLQTRTGKRSAQAALKIVLDMVKEGLIDEREALMRIEPQQLDQLLHPMFDPGATYTAVARGLPGSSGAAVGVAVFSSRKAEEWGAQGKDIILVRNETSPEDVGGMAASKGILTATGGLTSHAAVVGRGMGKCVVVGCGALDVDEKKGLMQVNGHIVREGDWVSISGDTGDVILGKVPLIEPTLSRDFEKFMKWADKVRQLEVWANADTPKDARMALRFGAEGIGLARTEHMFFTEERLPLVQQMILAKSDSERDAVLKKLLPMQRKDFQGIFTEMKGRPVVIRLLDPPLHEFLPRREEILEELYKEKARKSHRKKQISELSNLLHEVEAHHEFNPMLGHRGCRLGITFPSVYDMQVRAIMEAAVKVKKNGHRVRPEIMIPLTGTVGEMAITRENAVRVAEEVLKKAKVRIHYTIGTMIEIPRASLVADKIAKHADFFSFGTNDMTQMMFGYSRDDAARFLGFYVEQGILEDNPFSTLDVEGVGEMIKIGVERGRSTRPDLSVGICGEHGGDPASIEFCHVTGLDYVSCSPYRIPVARLAAAQAAIRAPRS
ncbi:pyruvate, phosphate dikinase [Nitrospinae bacterium AH_259_B05_G02_I21]|nr:pyruvate, phosphate dikinase [Nitrospinae bacterium AH_259_B05_G02_I21]MDA2931544.1 pyruvate, phosphate dikinase [Nitrospinae bacterium AH-259-F20]